MPGRVSEIRPEVDSGQDDVHVLPMEHPERHAVGRRAVDTVGRRGGLVAVIECPAEDCSTSGATTLTSPNFFAAFASAAMPGLYTPSSFETKMRIRFPLHSDLRCA